MISYSLVYPEYLDGYENETEAKGYLSEVRIVVGEVVYDLTVYDPIRLAQEVNDELVQYGYMAVGNLLVVPRVNREEIAQAVAELSEIEFQGLLS